MNNLKNSQVNSTANVDELERFLADGCTPVEDPLQWWISNRPLYPHLSKLAISVHSVPGVYIAYHL